MTALAQRRGACPALSAPMQTGDGLLVRLNPVATGLPTAALTGLCESAARHGNGIMEITQRGSIQIRGLTSESASLLADDVNALGIVVRTGVPVETSPLAGIDPDETADPRPLAEAIRTAIENAGLSRRLGPKVSVVVDGGGRIGMGALLADVRLTAVRHEQETCWHLAVGGTADTARPVGLVAEADAVGTTLETLEAIAALGREGRGRNIAAGHTPTPNPSPQGGGESRNSQAASDGRNDGADLSPSPLWGGVRGGDARPSPLTSAPLLGTFLLANATHALGVALPFGS
ncbi:MAG: precorrin-3B synthase, partial [Mesorhizobium sp.]